MMNNLSKVNLAGIGLISFGALLYQICLTRILAVTVWYHFVFLVISLSMLGMSASAMVCFFHWERFTGKKYKEYMALFCILFSILSPLAVYIHLNLNFNGVMLGTSNFYLILAVQLLFFTGVFFSAGMCINIILFEGQSRIGKIYFFDLLGAALGSFLAVPLMYYTSSLAIVFLISAIGLFTAWLFLAKTSSARSKSLLLILLIINIFLFFKNDSWEVLKIHKVKSPFERIFQHKEWNGKIFEKWSPFSRITVFSLPVLENSTKMPRLLVENDAGARTHLFKFEKNYWNIKYFKTIVPKFETVYQFKKYGDALIIGSGGGIDVLAALVFQQKSITAVEVNPIIAEIVTKRFADYIGHIFNYPQVKLYVQEGRNFVARSRNKYDTIQITMVDSWTPASFSAYIFNENSLYTKEAIHNYISHLKPAGVLSISRYYFWAEALRLTNTMVECLEENNIRDIQNRIVVIIGPLRKSRIKETFSMPPLIMNPFATVLIKNGPFETREINIIRDFAQQKGSAIVYAPYLSESQMDPSKYASYFRDLILSQSQKQNTRKKLVASYPRDITPSTDDKPFFFFMLRFRDLFNLDSRAHMNFRDSVFLLYKICFLVSLFSILMILVPLYLFDKVDPINKSFPKRNLLYFAFIGLGFMFIELSLIQRLTVFLGQPVYALVVVLSSLLLSGAIGSLTSARLVPLKEVHQLKTILKVIIGLGGFIAFIIYDRLIGLMWLNNIHRILLCIAIIVPLGFMLGMCLPLGMRIIQKWDRRLIVWAWGINGAFSVFGSVMSIILALNFGLKSVFLIGIGCYLVSWMIMKHETKPQTHP